MTDALRFNIRPVTTIDDETVLNQISTKVLEELGEDEGSGFDLRTNKRDLFFTNGYLRYQVDEPSVEVFME